jgi:hypothetical protein
MALKLHLVLLLAATSALAQTKATINVDVNKPINVMTAEAIGVYTDLYDGGVSKPLVAAYMHAAGMYTLRLPGGYGSYPDLYHWTTNSALKYQNFAKQDHYIDGAYAMKNLVATIDKTGTAIITVDYGSNMAGNGGGEPLEAAAWVAYMNGDPSNTQPLGKDSTGADWHTVGYWASLRAAAPLDADDGLNNLRANHPKPLAIKLWEIGSEVYNNGYYGGDHKSEEDLHTPYPASENDNEKRRKNPNLAPAFYGQRIVEFSKAMKTVDPSVWIGAALTLNPIDTFAPDWNPDVLKAACGSIEFGSYTWRADYRQPGPANDYRTRDESSTLRAPEADLSKFLPEAVYEQKKFCPAAHDLRVAITQMSPIHWAAVPNPLTDGLFAADAIALLIESGTINTDWTELHDGYFLNENNQPGPAYYGIQMLHIVAFRPGDQFVTTDSSTPTVAAHATHRSDGSFGLILINKDPTTAAEVKVNVSGGNFALQGGRFDYGPDNLKTTSGPTKTAFKSGGNAFTLTIPPYTITDIVLLKAQ